MNDFPGIRKPLSFLFVLCLAITSFYSHAITINPLLVKNFQDSKIGTFYHSNHDNLYILRKNQDQHEVVKIDLSNNQATILLSEPKDLLALESDIFELNGIIHLAAIKNQATKKLQLFRLNNSESFEPVTEEISFKTTTKLNNVFFIQLQNLSLLWSDGHTTNTFSTNKTTIPLCFFDSKHFIFAEGLVGKFDIAVYNQGSLEHPFASYYFEETETNYAQTSDACLLSAYDDNSEAVALYFNKTGELDIVEKHYDFIGASDQAFLTLEPPTSIHTSEPLQKVDQNTLEILSTNRVLDRFESIIDIIPNHDRFIVLTKGSGNSTNFKVKFVDTQLNILSENQTIKAHHKIISNFNSDFILTDDKLLVYQAGIQSSHFSINPQLKHFFVANKSSRRAFYVNRLASHFEVTNQIYSLDQKPNIGQQMAGTWVDLRYKNQGVSITPGIRSDGSRYIFLALFTFQDNQPLWLAGTYDYTANESEASVNLFEFEGAGFIDTETTPSGQLFGTLRLNFESCNVMSGELNHNNNTVSLELNRIDDTSYGLLCVD